MRRFSSLLIAGAVLVFAACHDSIAPTRSVGEPAALSYVATSPRSLDASGASTDASVLSTEFLIPAAGGTVRVGDFVLRFPANSVCELGSGYGSDYWNKPCETVGHDFRIRATFWHENGEAVVHFSPDIRFSPDAPVIISTNRQALLGRTSAEGFEFWYWTYDNGLRVKHDESADPDLQTKFNSTTGDVWRRIKHFSGISINSG